MVGYLGSSSEEFSLQLSKRNVAFLRGLIWYLSSVAATSSTNSSSRHLPCQASHCSHRHLLSHLNRPSSNSCCQWWWASNHSNNNDSHIKSHSQVGVVVLSIWHSLILWWVNCSAVKHFVLDIHCFANEWIVIRFEHLTIVWQEACYSNSHKACLIRSLIFFNQQQHGLLEPTGIFFFTLVFPFCWSIESCKYLMIAHTGLSPPSFSSPIDNHWQTISVTCMLPFGLLSEVCWIMLLNNWQFLLCLNLS